MGATISTAGDPARGGGRRRTLERRRQIAALCGLESSKTWVDQFARAIGLTASDAMWAGLRLLAEQKGHEPPPGR